MLLSIPLLTSSPSVWVRRLAYNQSRCNNISKEMMCLYLGDKNDWLKFFPGKGTILGMEVNLGSFPRWSEYDKFTYSIRCLWKTLLTFSVALPSQTSTKYPFAPWNFLLSGQWRKEDHSYLQLFLENIFISICYLYGGIYYDISVCTYTVP